MRGMKPGSGRRGAPAVVSAGEPLLPSAPGCTHGRRVLSSGFGCERARGGRPTAMEGIGFPDARCASALRFVGGAITAPIAPSLAAVRSPPRRSDRLTVDRRVAARIPLLTLDAAISPARPAATPHPAYGSGPRPGKAYSLRVSQVTVRDPSPLRVAGSDGSAMLPLIGHLDAMRPSSWTPSRSALAPPHGGRDP